MEQNGGSCAGEGGRRRGAAPGDNGGRASSFPERSGCAGREPWVGPARRGPVRGGEAWPGPARRGWQRGPQAPRGKGRPGRAAAAPAVPRVSAAGGPGGERPWRAGGAASPGRVTGGSGLVCVSPPGLSAAAPPPVTGRAAFASSRQFSSSENLGEFGSPPSWRRTSSCQPPIPGLCPCSRHPPQL